MHTSVHDSEPAVKRGRPAARQLALRGLPRPPIPDQTILDVGAFVRATWLGKGLPVDAGDLFQDAAEVALETRQRYGHTIDGNPFTYLCGPAFTETKLRSLRARAVLSLSEKKAALATEQQRVPLREDHAWEEAPDVFVRGELERRQKVARLIGRLDLRGRRLIAIAFAEPEVKLRKLALRTKMGRKRAAKVLRSLVRVVGDDPAFDHLRRVISRA